MNEVKLNLFFVFRRDWNEVVERVLRRLVDHRKDVVSQRRSQQKPGNFVTKTFNI